MSDYTKYTLSKLFVAICIAIAVALEQYWSAALVFSFAVIMGLDAIRSEL